MIAHPSLPDLSLLPGRVPGRPFWPLFAGLVAAVPDGATVGLKSIETRTYETEPGFLLVCSTKRTPSAHIKNLWPHIPEWAHTICQLQSHAVAPLYISGCRPLLPEDEPRAWFYEPGRFAWEIARSWPLRPFHVNGFQGKRYFERQQVLEAIR